MKTIRSALTPRFGILTLIAMILAGSLGLTYTSAGAPPPPTDEESPELQPVSEESEIARGTTLDGNSWSAVRYDTMGGLTCIDIKVPSAGTNGATQSSGGCFDRSAPVTQRGRFVFADGASTVVFGVLEGSGHIRNNGDRGLRVAFTSNDVIAPTLLSDGVFVGAGEGLPLTLEYQSSTGQPWRHAFGDGRPRS